MSYSSTQIERNYVLYARMQNAKDLFTILKAINFKEVIINNVCRCPTTAVATLHDHLVSLYDILQLDKLHLGGQLFGL